MAAYWYQKHAQNIIVNVSSNCKYQYVIVTLTACLFILPHIYNDHSHIIVIFFFFFADATKSLEEASKGHNYNDVVIIVNMQ